MIGEEPHSIFGYSIAKVVDKSKENYLTRIYCPWLDLKGKDLLSNSSGKSQHVNEIFRMQREDSIYLRFSKSKC